MTDWTQNYPNQGGWVPPGGYEPPLHQQADPLVSPTYGGWWQRGVAIARRGWKPIALVQVVGLAVALMVQAPVAVYGALISDDLQRGLTTTNDVGQLDMGPLFGLFGFTIAGALLSVIVTGIVTLAVVHIGASVAVGAPVRIGDSLQLAVRRLLPMIGWQLLAVPIFVVGLCLCVLPVFYVWAVLAVLPVVVAVERTNAIGRCFTLFHKDFGASAGRLATIIGLTIGVSILSAIVGGVFQAVASASLTGDTAIIVGSIVSTLVGAVLGGALAILVAPLTLAAYADMRARVEPTNALTITYALGITPPPAPWSPAPGLPTYPPPQP
ncbi:hypothetical protein [Asanoa iriomotensis]|uniref:Glycerophosphoryl diester phosphodiesterase membrane domain-containing protein n=1 Tax=Asanoa iriomotensis TaxID=234613 RepID=A0ABQ4BXG4_9ACTN|nr:hypothetical protein [Asanoa iriomotensis]GIF55203.1 hypothetical protein Air01nite_12980 [Asanoa iriomotensis]